MSFFFLGIFCAVVAVTWRAYRLKQSQYPYPPGPPADPIIGHARKLPTERVEEKFHEWAQVYGALYKHITNSRMLSVHLQGILCTFGCQAEILSCSTAIK
jgi:hypothetical protein